MSWPFWFGALLTLAGLLTAAGEIAARKNWVSLFSARKGVHITVALCCAVAVEIIPFNPYFILGVGLIVLLLWLSVSKQWFSIDRMHDRRSWGIFYFGLSYFLLLLFWGENSPITVVFAMAVMGLADALAALIGRKFPLPSLTLGREEKSWAGSITFFFIAFILLLGGLLQLQWATTSIDIVAILFLVFWLTAVENSAGKGTDNLSVPLLFGAVFPFLFGPMASPELLSRFIWIAPFAALFFLGTTRLKSLTRDGGITAASLGVLLYSLGGWMFVIPLFLFFGTGSLLSRVLKINTQTVEKTGARDPWQVLANGAIPAFALLLGFYSNNLHWAFLGYLGAVAAANADTWSTEWGMRYGGTPRGIFSLQPVPKGKSGGVSAVGLIAAMAGSALIACSGLLFLPFGSWFFAVTLIGFSGSLVDSALGAFQAYYHLPANTNNPPQITEQKKWNGIPLPKAGGIRWLENDLVNFISSATSLGATLLYAATTL